MGIKEQLLEDYKSAMKSHDDVRKNTINLARAAIKQYEVDNRVDIDEQGVFDILTKQVKMRKDALKEFEEAGRTDLLAAYEEEIGILESYLPEQLSDEKLDEIISAKAAELGIEKGAGKKLMGQLMKPVMAEVKGLADGNEVRKKIEIFLG